MSSNLLGCYRNINLTYTLLSIKNLYHKLTALEDVKGIIINQILLHLPQKGSIVTVARLTWTACDERVVMCDREIDFRNSNVCPTWFISNSQNNCQSGDGQSNLITYDDKATTSAVLDCYSVTYKSKIGSTLARKCFYNCEKFNVTYRESLTMTWFSTLYQRNHNCY